MWVRMENTIITAFVLFVNEKLRENFDCLEKSVYKNGVVWRFFFFGLLYMHLAIYSALGSRFHYNHKSKNKTKQNKTSKTKSNEIIK